MVEEVERDGFVYVIRFERKFGNDDVETGSFEWCYRNEQSAIKAMKEDWKNDIADLNYKGNVVTTLTDDYASFKCDNGDYEKWFIDKLGVI